MNMKATGLLVVLLAGVVVVTLRVAAALFTDSAPVPANSFANDTLGAPTGLTATGGASVTLNWTPTTDTYASGHRVFRGTASGGPYSQIAQVTPRTTATYVDSPGAGSFYYVLRAYYQSWESVDSSQVSSGSTGYRNCTANSAVTTSSGDNDGFQLNPGNGCADDAAFAEDTNGGSGNSLSCASTARDRHLYNNYGFSIPAGSTINGIEVRLDAWSDATSGNPAMCVELSWNGGTSWTAAETTATLGTSQASFTLGAAGDTWGRSWTASTDFTDANFRIRITDIANSTAREFRLDWAAVRVTYTPP